MRILLFTRSYPSDGDLYQYPFVHRRVLAYRKRGHDVSVFRLAQARGGRHVFDSVTCETGDDARFAAAVGALKPDVIAAHGLSEEQWPALERGRAGRPVCAWFHGSEIPEFCREKAAHIADAQTHRHELAVADARAEFWKRVLSPWPDHLHMVFVSRNATELMRQDLGALLRQDRLSIIPNPIDTDLFCYCPKSPESRFHVLSIRPHTSHSYGNDMAVRAVRMLSAKPLFSNLRFTFAGDGPMFEETFAPLRNFANVTLLRRFLIQKEIARYHRQHGQFLVPTRLDTQGVSRDEAMSSGLVPLTNRVFAVPEFADDSCAYLAEAGDCEGLARGIELLAQNPQLFLAKSAAAAARVRAQSGHAAIVSRELDLLESIAS